MSASKLIQLRPGSANYQVRYNIPVDKQDAMGGSTYIRRSLGTPDRKEAAKRAPGKLDEIIAEVEAKVAEAQRRAAPPAPVEEPTWEQIERAARIYYRTLIDSDKKDRRAERHLRTFTHEEAAEEWREYEREVRLACAGGDYRHVPDDVFYDWCESCGLQFNPGSDKEDDLHALMVEAEAEAAGRIAEQWGGLPIGRAANPMFDAPVDLTEPLRAAPVEKAQVPPGATLMEEFETYARAKGPGMESKTLDLYRMCAQRLSEHVGPDKPVAEISYQDARNWRDGLLHWPIKADRKALAGMTFPEIVNMNKAEERFPVVSASTINKYLRAVSAVFSWLEGEGALPFNVWSKIRVGGKASEVRPFFSDELARFFGSPLFVGCVGEDDLASPGNVQIRDWRFWLPLIGLYSGARLAEIGQLETADIREESGVWLFDINEAGGLDLGKRVKTVSGRRTVPIHSSLIGLGFLEYHAQRLKTGEKRLFPEIHRVSGSTFTKASRFFAGYMNEIGVKTAADKNRLVFHSLRHNFTDALGVEYSRTDVAPLLGHSEGPAVTSSYASVPALGLRKRKEMIETVRYCIVDVSRISAFCRHQPQPQREQTTV